jgi:glutamate formiminotransferase
VFECVLNISEGRDELVLDELSALSGPSLRDRHRDERHHRSVFTLINDPEQLIDDVRSLIGGAFNRLSLREHEGVHPRFGVVDVVPFVALAPDERARARQLRDDTAKWIASTFGVATFLYGELDGGENRTLPDVRRRAFLTLDPDFGPLAASASLGAVAVGERPVLIAWNLWLANTTIQRARELAANVRSEDVRALGFDLGGEVQVSCNLLDVGRTTPSMLYDAVASQMTDSERITRCELVGLVPTSLLEREPPARWEQLDLSPTSTIESRLGP